MNKIYLLFIGAIFFTCNISAQCAGLSEKELEEFGPWLCPGYNPSPGFPGNPSPIELPEVIIKPSDPSIPGSPYYPYPVIPTPPPGSGTTTPQTKIPCPGDPTPSPSIAPSAGWNYEGGTYGMTRVKGTKFHDGIDIKAEPGTIIYSMYDGEVVAIKKSMAPGEYKEGSYGNFIMIKSYINNEIVYLKFNHLDGVNKNLNVGQTVKQGDPIGISGTTGNAASQKTKVIPHVHIQAKNSQKKSINPEPYLSTKFNHKTGKGTSPCNN